MALNMDDYHRYVLHLWPVNGHLIFSEEKRETRRAKFNRHRGWFAGLDENDAIVQTWKGPHFTDLAIDEAIVMTQLFDVAKGALPRARAKLAEFTSRQRR